MMHHDAFPVIKLPSAWRFESNQVADYSSKWIPEKELIRRKGLVFRNLLHTSGMEVRIVCLPIKG